MAAMVPRAQPPATPAVRPANRVIDAQNFCKLPKMVTIPGTPTPYGPAARVADKQELDRFSLIGYIKNWPKRTAKLPLK